MTMHGVELHSSTPSSDTWAVSGAVLRSTFAKGGAPRVSVAGLVATAGMLAAVAAGDGGAVHRVFSQMRSPLQSVSFVQPTASVEVTFGLSQPRSAATNSTAAGTIGRMKTS